MRHRRAPRSRDRAAHPPTVPGMARIPSTRLLRATLLVTLTALGPVLGGCGLLGDEGQPESPDVTEETAPEGDPVATELIALELDLDLACRGGSGDDPETLQACEDREEIVRELNDLGYCYGHTYEATADWHWHQCEEGSNSY